MSHKIDRNYFWWHVTVKCKTAFYKNKEINKGTNLDTLIKAITEILIFRVVTLCIVLQMDTDILEKHFASTFRAKHDCSRLNLHNSDTVQIGSFVIHHQNVALAIGLMYKM